MKTLLSILILTSFLLVSCAINEIEKPDFDDELVEWSTPFSDKTIKRDPAYFKIKSRSAHAQRRMGRY